MLRTNPFLRDKTFSAAYACYDNDEDEDSERQPKRRGSAPNPGSTARSQTPASMLKPPAEDVPSDYTPISSGEIKRMAHSCVESDDVDSKRRNSKCDNFAHRQGSADVLTSLVLPSSDMFVFQLPADAPPACRHGSAPGSSSDSDGSSGRSLRRAVERLTMDSDEYMADAEVSLGPSTTRCGKSA